MDPVLKGLAEAISESDDLESMVRSLLDILQSITGLESTYLTTVDLDRGVQQILFARNSRQLQLPEGLAVPWGDTLCKRAMDEGCYYTDAVSQQWGDSQAASELGIATYLSQPVYVAQGELYGTLCGASASRKQIDDDALRLLEMFAQLIARQVERERLLERLHQENRTYRQHASIDPLTGIFNRRTLLHELSRALEVAQRSDGVVHVAFIDLDGFKQINDTHGHDAGDRFLLQMAARLTDGARQADVVARYGGDEFVIFGLDFSSTNYEEAGETFRARMEALTRGRFAVGEVTLDYDGASVGVASSRADEQTAEGLIRQADEAMYAIKKQRKHASV